MENCVALKTREFPDFSGFGCNHKISQLLIRSSISAVCEKIFDSRLCTENLLNMFFKSSLLFRSDEQILDLAVIRKIYWYLF